MAIKNNTVNKSNKSLSKTNDKRSELLIKVDNLMEKLDNDYGPLLLDELNKRLEKTIEDFHSDLKSVLESSFKAYDERLKNLENLSSESPSKSTPSFIAEYESKVKNKNK